MSNRNLKLGLSLAVALGAAACAPESGDPASSRSLVQIDLPATYAPAAEGGAVVPEWYKLTISGPDLESAETFTGTVGQSLSISAPAGEARIFTLEIHRSTSLDYLTWRGRSAPVNLTAGQPASVNIQLLRTGENQAPTLASIRLRPADYYVTTPIAVDAVLPSDFEGDDVTLGYQWFVNGEEVAGQTGPALAGAFSHFDKVHAVVTASDHALSKTFETNRVAVQNSPPVIKGVKLVKLNLRSDAIIDPPPVVTDADGDEVQLLYTWYVDGAQVPSWSGDYLPSGTFAKNDAVYVIVKAYDGYDYGDAVKSNTVFARRGGGNVK